MTTDPRLCPCTYPDIDPETDLCECGHWGHDEDGHCLTEVQPSMFAAILAEWFR